MSDPTTIRNTRSQSIPRCSFRIRFHPWLADLFKSLFFGIAFRQTLRPGDRGGEIGLRPL